MSFQQVFGGTVIFPSDATYESIELDADLTLEWPLEASTAATVAARTIDVTPASANLSITMPPADQTGPGQIVMFINRGPYTYDVLDNDGGAILTIADGQGWVIILTDNTDAAGAWYSYQNGSVTSQAQAAMLAGYGLVAQSGLLSQSQDVILFNSDYTAGPADRASTYVWTSGLGTLTLSSASSLGNNWFMAIRNEGSGNLTVACSGGDLINGEATLDLQPGDSCTINTDGTSFYTVGLGQNAVFAFDYTSINLTGEVDEYVLSGSELNRIAYDFVGTLTTNMVIRVPETIQQYWVANDTTGGSFTLSIGTTSQAAPIVVPRGSRGIYYSYGSTLVNAATASIATPLGVSEGGTGATTPGGALINLGGTSVGIAVFTAANAGVARLGIGAAASGANNDITSLSGLTTPLAVAEGGTGGATAADARTNLAVPGLTTANTFSGKQTINGSSTTLALALKNASEPATIAATAATGTINYNLLDQSIWYFTANAAANWAINLRGDGTTSMNTLLATGDSVTCVHLVPQGATAYYNSAVQVDATTVGVTTKWLNGAPIAGSPSGIDLYSYTIIKTGASTFTVLASRSPFS